MADQIKRLNYFKHQFLRASDFVDEQKYHVDMRRRHNRMLHTWGIAGSGLKVTFAQGATAVSVSPGMAVDSQGREIVLTEERTLDLSGLAGASLYVTISYTEKQTNPSNETGAEGNTRVTEEPLLQGATARPADVGTNIVLARVTRNGLVVNGVDESERRAAGVEAGDLTVRTLTLSRQTVDASAWPRLSCSAANLTALENGSLRIDANREVLFADGGQLRSLDNSHRIVFNRANNRLELHEFGDIAFHTGGASPAERMRVSAAGNVGIGVTAAPEAQLHVSGGQWDVGATEGDFKIGNAALRLKIGVALAGAGAGDVRLRAQGGTNRLMLGTGTADTLTVTGGRVGIGTISPNAKLEINDGDLIFRAAADDPGDIVFQSANGTQKARIFADPTPGAGLMFAVGDNVSRLTIDGSGNIGINHTAPTLPLDVSGRMRTRSVPSGTAGMWYTNAAGADRSFIGLQDDNTVGFWSNTGPGWSFVMDLNTAKIRSPMWRVIRVFEASPGTLPKQAAFVSNGGTMMIYASGSGFINGAAGQIGMSVKVDGVVRGNARGFSNEVGSHKTFVPVLLVESIAAGSHTISLEPLGATVTDFNDFFNVTIVEMPI